MSLEAALARVLDRDGFYWSYPGEATDDPTIERIIEVRLDTSPSNVTLAQQQMAAGGWELHAEPDVPDDPHQRLYFRKQQSLSDGERTEMLTTAMRAAEAANGRFWSWINRPDDTEN